MNVTLELRPLDSTDMDLCRRWRNTYAIWRWCRQSDLISDVEQAAWFERQAKDPTIKMWKLVATRPDAVETVGVCGLTSIDWQNRRAEFSLYVGPEHQKRSYGRVGLAMLLEHGFKNLGLNQIWGESFEGNPALKLFMELGFKQDGIRRQFYFRDGRFIDAHLVSILAEEWHGRGKGAAHNSGADHPGRNGTPDSSAPPTPIRRAAKHSSQASSSTPDADGGEALSSIREI